MPYAESTTVFQLVPGIRSAPSAAADAMNANIRRADDLINGKLARRYTVPFTTTAVPPLVRTIAEDLSAGMLFRSLFTRDSQNKNNWSDDMLDRAMELLDQISIYEIDLADTAGALVAERNIGSIIDSTTENQAAVFDLDSETSQVISPDRLDTISSSKR